MKVYLIRHAQSIENARGLDYRLSQTAFNAFLDTTQDAPLSTLGFQQAQHLASVLAGASIERLYTSPFARALSTATVLGQSWGVTPRIVPDLHEVMPSRPPQSDRELALFWHFLKGYVWLAVPTPMHESWFDVYRRAQRVWQFLIRESVAVLAVVSHFAFLHILLLVAHLHWRCTIHGYHLNNGGVTCVEIC